ncbi:hypothetical protein ABT352_32825 [Streptosporangium sp. NPDC000563]|uniref:hypothetical protein n=1 Tax=Streptosporangium sp. NPDC000563 TaxID=3154366 RepID=UPI00332D8A69
MYETRAYDNEHGQPVVVLVATGTHDVSRLAHLLNGGTCEQISLARQVTRQVKRHNGGRAALRLLADHGGPDLLTRVGETPPLFDVTTDTPDLPIDADAPPALRMLKMYAARTLHAYALAHKTYPSLDRTPAREEMNRWRLRYSFASYAYGVVHLLRELIEHAPDKADEIAQTLWNAWRDAETDESVRDWLTEWGIDPEKIVQEAFEDAKTADADLGVGTTVVVLATAYLRVLRFGPNDATCLVAGEQVSNTLCGIDLFAPDTPTWAIGGQHTNPEWTYTPCPGCVEAARTSYPGQPIVGVLPVSEPVAAELGVQALNDETLLPLVAAKEVKADA